MADFFLAACCINEKMDVDSAMTETLAVVAELFIKVIFLQKSRIARMSCLKGMLYRLLLQ